MQPWCEFRYCLSDHGIKQGVGVVEIGRFKVMVNMSSDHAGIAKALQHLEREIYRVVAHIEDPRKLRHYFGHLDFESQQWCIDHQVDDRGWMERTRKAAK